MRLIPLLTAVLVTLALCALVFERDSLLAFARGDDATEDLDAAEGGAVTEDSGPIIGVLVQQSKAQIIDSAVILRGETQADREVEVRSETTAIVISSPVRKGTYVQAGDTLCQLDPGIREASLAEMQARLAEAETRVPESAARLIESQARLEEARILDNAADKLS